MPFVRLPDNSSGENRIASMLRLTLPVGASLLLVGESRLSTPLTAAGYRVTVFSANSGDLRPTAVNEPRSNFFALALDKEFDALVLDSAWSFLSPVDVFDQAPRLIPATGTIFLIDRFCLRRSTEDSSGSPLPEYVERLANRAGFSLQRLAQLADLPDKEEIELLLSCRRQTMPRWQVGWIHPARSLEMRTLFQEVFGHEMSDACWQWKYGMGRGCGIGIWRTDNGKLIAHYGGTTRPAFAFGRPVMAFQACDLMVSGSDRGSFSRQGPVFLAAASYLENQLGFGAPHLLGIGFPNERAYRLPERLGLYSGCLGRIQEVSWSAQPLGRQRLLWNCQEVFPDDLSLRQLLDACWQDMLSDMQHQVIGVRDADYLMLRYLQHPEKKYRVFLVRHRLKRRHRGVIVLRALDQNRFELLDIIAAVSNIPALTAHARSLAHHSGARNILAWLVDNILPCFSGYDDVQDLGVLVPGNQWTEGPANDSVQGRWWLTGGDTDFR